MNMQSVCNNHVGNNKIEKTWQLFDIVKDDPKLIEIAIALLDIQKKKEDVSLDQLQFIPDNCKIFFEKKVVEGKISFNDYLSAGNELIHS